MSLKVSRVLHAGYVFECGATKIVFDPVFETPFSRNCHAFPHVTFDIEQIQELRFDAVFISHYHDDHCCLESLDLLKRETPIYLYCIHDELFSILRALGFAKVFALKLGCPVNIGAFAVTPLRALDCDIDSIFHIQAAGINILNVVDSWLDPDTLSELAGRNRWDMVLWPFQTLLEIDVLAPTQARAASRSIPPEWLEQLKLLNPRSIVPSSCQFIHEDWSWYNQALFPITYRQFTEDVKTVLPQAQVLRLDPASSVQLTSLSIERTEPLRWLHVSNKQGVEVDYSYDFKANGALPTTGEIAKHFVGLSPPQLQRVVNYCQQELLSRYRELGPSSEPFLAKPVRWRLSLFSNDGQVVMFDYSLSHNDSCLLNMETCDSEARGSASCDSETPGSNTRGIEALMTAEILPPDWHTEVPIMKLYAALESGESLTSMYLRISSTQQVDALEDPLIRCLFSGKFATFQKAQLEKLQLKKTQLRKSERQS